MRKRVLFVDDEASVLSALQRTLRDMRQEWEMAFAESGSRALALISEKSFDVVVTDMRMPGMDGAELLNRVKTTYPGTTRIILSGHIEQNQAIRSAGVAHQYLAKPCNLETLKMAVRNATALRSRLGNEKLKQVLSEMGSLPSVPSLYAQVMEAVQAPDASAAKIGRIISKDPAMTAKVLQLVNSAFFGLRQEISSAAQATAYLGLERVHSLLLSVQVFSQFEESRAPAEFPLEQIWCHSLHTGTLAKRIALREHVNKTLTEHSFTAGLLHDVGKLLLASKFSELYSSVLSVVKQKRKPVCEAELEIIGATHQEVGAYLLALWGLPDPIVEAIAYHHRPSQFPDRSLSPLAIVHVADVLDRENSGGEQDTDLLDSDYFSQMPLRERLGAWKELAPKLKESAGATEIAGANDRAAEDNHGAGM